MTIGMTAALDQRCIPPTLHVGAYLYIISLSVNGCIRTCDCDVYAGDEDSESAILSTAFIVATICLSFLTSSNNTSRRRDQSGDPIEVSSAQIKEPYTWANADHPNTAHERGCQCSLSIYAI